jgi:predicted ATPase
VLKSLHFQNFKSWKKVDLPLGRITALFGANSLGKSSLIQFLLMLKQTKDSPDRALTLDFGGLESAVDLGSFRDAVYGHQIDELSHGGKMPEELKIADPFSPRSVAAKMASRMMRL